MAGHGNTGFPRIRNTGDAVACVVRAWVAEDIAAVRQLLHDGLLPGDVESELADCDCIEDFQIDSEGGELWVAEAHGQIVGTVAMAMVSRDVVQLRCLRVAPAWQAGHRVARQLVAVAAAYAREMGFLKLIIQGPLGSQPEITAYFHRLGFEFSRITTSAGQHRLEFYRNVYERPEGRSGDVLFPREKARV